MNSATPGNQQVALAWSAPGTNGGASIDGYYVHVNGTRNTTLGLVGGTSATVTGLQNGTQYSFTVTAHNSVGESSASNAKTSHANRRAGDRHAHRDGQERLDAGCGVRRNRPDFWRRQHDDERQRRLHDQ